MTNLEPQANNTSSHFKYVLNRFKNNLFRIFLILFGISCFAYYLLHFHKASPNFLEVKIADNIVYAQVADTENERSLGLSFTKKLDENAGMLFIFPTISQKNFWMRDMNYNIDIIWIDENKTVTGFVENADKNSYYPKRPNDSRIYRSPDNTKYVLETATGTISKFKIKAGDVLDFKY